MENKTGNKTFIKLLIPMIVVLAIICIARSGYKTGKWVHDIIHK